jgi:hypothetical protein
MIAAQKTRDSSVSSSHHDPAGPPPGASIQDAGAAEALRFKWLESEKAGRDLGQAAVRAWIRQHWNTFVRERWLEHLEGRAFWVELDHGDFGLLQREFPSSPLFEEIVRRIRAGGENLDIFCWSHEKSLSRGELRRLLQILEILDINSHRVDCQVLARLSQVG